ncbi:MAG: T9SS type A sorting domain-containing protein [Saprospirales bacterium]|nr:T9SS type A sorting domain-containing protein [Saprospirales bacterium]MBK8490382.1 T9SS type A sorting domain-containing protein [Saprospirales bacterium]
MKTTPKRIPFFPLIVAFLFAGSLHAQQLERTLLSSAGMQFDAGNVTMEWSVGEGVVAELSANNYRLTQGFHQGTAMISQVLIRGEWSHVVSIFPNPAGRELYLLKKGTEPLQLTIFDALGQLVSEETWNGYSKNLDVQTLNSGIYLILMKDDRGAFAGYKFIKQ